MGKKRSKTAKGFQTTLVLSAFLATFSCNNAKTKEILTKPVGHSDFEYSLDAEGVTEAVRSTTVTCPFDVEGKIVFLVDNGTTVRPGDTLCIIENKEMENQYESALMDIENAQADRAKSIADINLQQALLEAEVQNNAVQSDIANLDSLQLAFTSPVQRKIKELELQKTAIIKKKLEKKLQALKAINKSQIREKELQIQRRESYANRIKERLNQLTVRATYSGTAQRASSWMSNKNVQEGDQAWSEMPLVTLPDLTQMKVRIKAPEALYKQIEVNQNVEYHFDAMPHNTAWGKITKKAPVGQPVKENSKVKFFDIEASIDRCLVLPKPGLNVHCKVIINRIKDTLVVPQLAIFEEDSIKVVYVKRAEGYEKRRVKLCASSLESAVIADGLTGKEILSLIKPSPHRIVSNAVRTTSQKTSKKIKTTEGNKNRKKS